MKILPSLLTTAVLTLTPAAVDAQIVINELMQSNIDCIMDDLNEFPDSWVELYNAGQSSVNIAGYRLGIEDDASAAYSLPARIIAPGGYLLIYCDKVGNGMHTSFRLDSGKGAAV